MNKINLHPDVRIGHVHLRVANVQRSLEFYRDVLGFQIFGDLRPFGVPIVFLAAGDYHHHIALNASETSEDATPAGHPGLHHFAIVYPNARELSKALKNFFESQYPITGAYDHQATVSVFLKDPDGNGIELYYDRPRNEWFDNAGKPIIRNEKIDPKSLLGELENN
jgi:catechol 2,3-dioxygenase